MARLMFIACLFVLSLVDRAVAAPFVNLDFEQSTVQMTDPIVVPTTAAFPGWTAQFAGVSSQSVYHDYADPGVPIVAVFDQEALGAGFRLLQGNYMAYLSPGPDDERTALSQLGDVPGDARSFTLLCDGAAGPPTVTVNGAVIDMMYLSGVPFIHNVNTYGGDISAFAGTTADFRFECGARPEFDAGRRVFDDVRFSTSDIPEPSAATALMLLCLTLRGYRRPLNSPASPDSAARAGSARP